MTTSKTERTDKGILLIIDDDRIFADRLSVSMEKRGFDCVTAYDSEDAMNIADQQEIKYALIDMRIQEESGLELTDRLSSLHPACRIVMLTAFGNIATAVAAIKSGAVDYLAKPVDAETIESALLQQEMAPLPEPPGEPMSAERVKWEHVQRIYEQCDRNISETARRLRMHRRSLQRMLNKYGPRDEYDEDDDIYEGNDW
jgi:two-component system response regulator RegA